MTALKQGEVTITATSENGKLEPKSTIKIIPNVQGNVSFETAQEIKIDG